MALIIAGAKCRCWHCIRIAELVDVCQILRADADNLRRDLATEREGTALLLAERKRMEENNLDLARQLDESRAEYWRAVDAADEANETEARNLRDELNYWSLCESDKRPPIWPAVLACFVACFAAGVALRVWAEAGF